ncbi:MAG: CHASE2 domain-containing protein [Candidatus Latescibacterota bacterium]
MRRLCDSVFLGLFCTMFTLGIAQIGVVKDLLTAVEHKTWDYRMAHYRGPIVAPGVGLDEVIIVDIDERSLAELGHFSRWPRFYHAALIDTLVQAGAFSIGFDVLFVEPEGLTPQATQAYTQILSQKQTTFDTQHIENLLVHLTSDTLFGQAIGRSSRSFLGLSQNANNQWLHPLPILANQARGQGHVQVFPDHDGVVRRVRTLINGVPALGLQMALDALAQSWQNIQWSPTQGLFGKGWQIPTDEQKDLLIDFVGPEGTFLHESYTDVLHGRIHPSLFENRIVLIGASATGLQDHYPTPFSPYYPGVEVHATVIYNILNGRFITPANKTYEYGVLFVIGCMICLCIRTLKPWLAAGGVLLVMGTNIIVCFEQFSQWHIYAPLMNTILCWLCSIMIASGHRYWTEERSKLAIKRAFSRYVAPDVVESIAAHPERLGLGGDERVVTIGFIDIRNFTTLSENLSANQLVHFLNDYLSLTTEVILKEKGTVDKYIGDAIMMLFGAPNPLTDQADRACYTALTMCEIVNHHRNRWLAEGMPNLAIGVGLNTGIAAVGNMGSAQRFDYTAMGDSVNLASRLEGLTKVYGVSIVVGPETEAQARSNFFFRELDYVRVKGKNEPVRIFELLAQRNTNITAETLVSHFEEGLHLFRTRKWSQAQEIFKHCLELRTEDGPSKYYLDQIDHLLLSPPPPNWDGISIMVHK